MPDRYGENDRNDGYPQAESGREAAEIRALAIANCHLCDANGYRDGSVCDHIDHTAAAKRGMDMIREAMGWDS